MTCCFFHNWRHCFISLCRGVGTVPLKKLLIICKPPDFNTFRHPFFVQSVDFLLKHHWPSLQSSKAICNGRALHNVYASGFGENEKVQRNGRREKKMLTFKIWQRKTALYVFMPDHHSHGSLKIVWSGIWIPYFRE